MYAAESEDAARRGLLVATVLLVIPMVFFGAVGIIAEAGVESGVISGGSELKSPLFAVLTIVHPAWSVFMLIMATFLSASTIDTFSGGFASLVAGEMGAHRLNLNWARFVSLCVFILALVTAINNPPSVMKLFMVSNLMTACLTPVLLLSLWPIICPTGATAGIVSGALAVCVMGWSKGENSSFGDGFTWWLLPEWPPSWLTLYTFLAAGGACGVKSLTEHCTDTTCFVPMFVASLITA